jgi:hypothetical protein
MKAEVGGAQGADATVIYEVARRGALLKKTQRSGSLWVNKTRKNCDFRVVSWDLYTVYVM